MNKTPLLQISADDFEQYRLRQCAHITEQYMDDKLLEHQKRRMEDGIARADRALIRQYLGGWYQALLEGSDCFTQQMCVDAVIAMQTKKSARDVLILSVINTELTLQDAVHISVNMPKGAYSREIMSMLDHAFRRKNAQLEQNRGQHAINCLVKMIYTVPAAYTEHPFAVLAYIFWYVGDGAQAMVCAQRALAVNPDNTLSQIIIKAVVRNMYPRSADIRKRAGIRKCI